MIELEHQENRIKILHDNIDLTYLYMQTHGPDYQAQLEEEFKTTANRLFLVCCVYFEARGLKSYLQDFKTEISSFINDDEKLFGGTQFDDRFGQSFSLFHDKIGDYLNAFPAFSSLDFIMKRSGLKYLEHILESTQVILTKMNVQPQSETEVSRSVKFICEVTFADIRFLNEPFIKTAKCYKPDILIPSLNVAVEYKFAETTTRLLTTIDEILIDVKGYDNHPDYKLFYAVFYIKAGMISPQRFLEIWKEKGFPKNWKGILVNGNLNQNSFKGNTQRI